MTDDNETDIAARIALRAAEEQGASERMDRIVASIQIIASALTSHLNRFHSVEPI